MVTNQQTKTTPPRLIRLLVASSLILVLVSLRVNADEQSAREALDHESTYQPLDYVAANALLPKWGGSREEVQQFVTLAVAKSSAAEGSQAYARIMFNIARGPRTGPRTHAGGRAVASSEDESRGNFGRVPGPLEPEH
jgi:hypothetical protein